MDLKDIIYVEGLQNYVVIHTPAGRLICLQALKKLAEQLPCNEFIRVHKSFIISLRHITSIERSRISIGGKIVPVGDSYREDFFNKINFK